MRGRVARGRHRGRAVAGVPPPRGPEVVRHVPAEAESRGVVPRQVRPGRGREPAARSLQLRAVPGRGIRGRHGGGGRGGPVGEAGREPVRAHRAPRRGERRGRVLGRAGAAHCDTDRARADLRGGRGGIRRRIRGGLRIRRYGRGTAGRALGPAHDGAARGPAGAGRGAPPLLRPELSRRGRRRLRVRALEVRPDLVGRRALRPPPPVLHPDALRGPGPVPRRRRHGRGVLPPGPQAVPPGPPPLPRTAGPRPRAVGRRAEGRGHPPLPAGADGRVRRESAAGAVGARPRRVRGGHAGVRVPELPGRGRAGQDAAVARLGGQWGRGGGGGGRSGERR